MFWITTRICNVQDGHFCCAENSNNSHGRYSLSKIRTTGVSGYWAPCSSVLNSNNRRTQVECALPLSSISQLFFCGFFLRDWNIWIPCSQFQIVCVTVCTMFWYRRHILGFRRHNLRLNTSCLLIYIKKYCSNPEGRSTRDSFDIHFIHYYFYLRCMPHDIFSNVAHEWIHA